MTLGDLSTRGTEISHFLNKKVCYLWQNDRHSLYRVSKNEEILFYLLPLPSNVALMNFDEISFVQLYTAQTVLLLTWWSTGRLLQYDIEHWNCCRSIRRAVMSKPDHSSQSQFTPCSHLPFNFCTKHTQNLPTWKIIPLQ